MTPTQPAQALAQAFAHLESRRIDEAKRIARALEKQRPDLPGLNYLLGLIAIEDKAGAKAFRHIARALKVSPDVPPLLLAAARAQAMQHRELEAETFYRRLIAVAPEIHAAQIELAGVLLRQGMTEKHEGHLESAHDCFTEAVTLDPGSILAQWLTAESYRAMGKTEESAAAYRRVLELDPEDRYGAGLALASLSQAAPPAHAPDSFVRALFDQYAETFDESLVDKLHYRGPVLLAEAIAQDSGSKPLMIFDAGCGTGLMATALSPLAGIIDGADLSPAMIEKARARGLYRELLSGDFIEILKDRPFAYDLVVAADVLVYIGDLAKVFDAISTALKPDGRFAFTVEKHDSDGWRLLPSGRYAHTPAYLNQMAQTAKMDIVTLDDVSTREDRGEAVPGLLCVMRTKS